ncbi:GntR family transcriptional regulator [Catellatospora sp. TT07R-123]|uniref:GntR family transcriptional regulator n=1 Tax=Catellatospora sp. TT07R-123 TaxID=2733863 RepID=UPI001B2D679E|nr:GntR family transcriptional regulator [Catellatospora sp. TT07R-123]GHJ43884.1 GntR family transcriptional regulator [Catellatospora sp. TT07R-123]
MPGPRYRAIAADLADRIRHGEYAPGTALPAQRELGSRYDVALATVRQALQALVDDGLIVVEAGRGTFVAPTRPAYRLDTLRSFVDDLRDQGHQVATRVVSCSLRAMPAWVAALWDERDTAARALRLERLRLVDGAPAIHQVSWVDQPYADTVRTCDFSQTALYAALADAGMRIASAGEQIAAQALPAASAALLGRPEGTPVLVSERVTRTVAGTVGVVDRAVIAAELAIRAQRTMHQVSVQWGAPARA